MDWPCWSYWLVARILTLHPNNTAFFRASEMLSFKQYGENEIGQLLGSGFFVDQNCRVATAKHLLENANKKGLYIKYIPPEDRNRFQTLIAEVIYEDENKDLAFLKPKNCYSKTIKPLPLIRKLDGLSSLGGETVYVGGFPRLGAQSVDFPILRKSEG